MTTDSNKISRLSSLYVLKAISAYIVVACHTPMWREDLFFGGILSLAVPIFYIITGYFLYNKDIKRTKRKCIQSIRKVLPIFICLEIIHYPLAPISGNISASWALWLRLLFLGFHSPNTIHLWYLAALIAGLIILYCFLSLTNGKYVLLLCSLAIIGFINGRYGFLFKGSSSLLTYNAISYAVPSLALGYSIAKYESEILLKKNLWITMTCLLLFASYVEYVLLTVGVGSRSIDGMFLTTLPLSGTVFILCLTNKSLGEGSSLEYIGQTYSSNIYYWHIIVAYLVNMLFDRLGLYFYYQSFGTIIVFMLSLALAWGIVKIQDRMGWSILR